MLHTLMSVVAVMSPGLDVDRGVNPRVLAAALKAPESKRAASDGPRYCIVDDLTRKSGRRQVCRTRREWARLGVEPITG